MEVHWKSARIPVSTTEGERERGREVSSYIWRDREIEKAREKRARLKGRQRNILF